LAQVYAALKNDRDHWQGPFHVPLRENAADDGGFERAKEDLQSQQ
jgi:hypothetical protein